MRTMLLTGSMGSGKTAVAAELVHRRPGTAALDLDWLGWMRPSEGSADDLIVRNLAAIWPNFLDAGARQVVMSRCVRTPGFVDRIRAAVPADLVVVRLQVSREQLEARLRKRDRGRELEQHLRELATVEDEMDRATPDAVRVDTAGLDIPAVARRVLDAWPA